jgi:histidinol-phosphate aminotransferase
MVNFSGVESRGYLSKMKVNYRLASNENPLGPSMKAIQAASGALRFAHHYPDTHQKQLKQTIANHLLVHPQQITLGNGSENLLELMVKSYLQKGDAAVISQFAFITITRLIKRYGARIIEVPVKAWVPDIEKMIQAIDETTRIVFLVNPNNPTGTYTNAEDFQRLMQAVPSNVLVVVDEAYLEYVSVDDYPSTLSYLADYSNLIVIRTFSKAYGLAGLRLGYAISSREIATQLDSVRLPYHVNAMAEKAGCEALLDAAHIQQTFLANQAGMRQMEKGLQDLGFSYIPSIANFITIQVGDAASMYTQLLQHGVQVMPLNDYGMPQHIRVTIGTTDAVQYFLQVMGHTNESR